MIKSLVEKKFPKFFSWAKNNYYVLYRAVLGKNVNEIIFTRIYKDNIWGNKYSRSGDGSDLENTVSVAAVLPRLIRKLDAETFLDIPCGDFFWMKVLDLPVKKYIGADIVRELIRQNNKNYSSEKREFIILDITSGPLPQMDIIFCRDCLPHLPFKSVIAALRQVRKSRSRYLLTSTYVDTKINKDINVGLFSPLNLELPPFNLCPPVNLIKDACISERVNLPGKSIGVWKISDLPDF